MDKVHGKLECLRQSRAQLMRDLAGARHGDSAASLTEAVRPAAGRSASTGASSSLQSHHMPPQAGSQGGRARLSGGAASCGRAGRLTSAPGWSQQPPGSLSPSPRGAKSSGPLGTSAIAGAGKAGLAAYANAASVPSISLDPWAAFAINRGGVGSSSDSSGLPPASPAAARAGSRQQSPRHNQLPAPLTTERGSGGGGGSAGSRGSSPVPAISPAAAPTLSSPVSPVAPAAAEPQLLLPGARKNTDILQELLARCGKISAMQRSILYTDPGRPALSSESGTASPSSSAADRDAGGRRGAIGGTPAPPRGRESSPAPATAAAAGSRSCSRPPRSPGPSKGRGTSVGTPNKAVASGSTLSRQLSARGALATTPRVPPAAKGSPSATPAPLPPKRNTAAATPSSAGTARPSPCRREAIASVARPLQSPGRRNTGSARIQVHGAHQSPKPL